MNEQDLKNYALGLLCKEHEWKEGESKEFDYKGAHYSITKNTIGFWEFKRTGGHKSISFATLGRLFNTFFAYLSISL